MTYIELSGNQINNSGLFWVILGYSGSYGIYRGSTLIGGLSNSVPCGVVPQGCTLSGGNWFYGVQLPLKEVKEWI